MKTKFAALAAGAALSALLAGTAAQALIYPTVASDYFGSFTDTGTSITFSNLLFSDVYSGTAAGIKNDRDLGGTNSDPLWPDAGINFGADVSTQFLAPTSQTYRLSLGSDDGGYMFVDGVLAINNGGIHGIVTLTQDIFLTAGLHNIEVQYDNVFCCGAVLDFSVGTVPEPTSWAFMILGVAGIGFAMRRRVTVTASA